MYFSFSMRFFVEIEVIIALLPERTSNFWLGKQFLLARIAWCAGLTRTVLLQQLHGGGQRATLRLRNRKVNVLRNSNLTHHHPAAPLARALQYPKKRAALPGTAGERPPSIAAEDDEIELAGILISL